MENTIKKLTNETSIETSTRAWNDKETVEGVQLKLNGSTATARVFNIALKLAALEWQDITIDQIENLLDSRLLEVANGSLFTIKCEKENGRTFDTWMKASSEDRARELVLYRHPEVKIINITKSE